MDKIAVLIPCYNEEKAIPFLYYRKVMFLWSTSNTPQRLRHFFVLNSYDSNFLPKNVEKFTKKY